MYSTKEKEYKKCQQALEYWKSERKYLPPHINSNRDVAINDAINYFTDRIGKIEEANAKNEPVMPDVVFEYYKLCDFFKGKDLSNHLKDRIKRMENRIEYLREQLINNQQCDNEIASIEFDLGILEIDCWCYINPDCRKEMEEFENDNEP